MKRILALFMAVVLAVGLLPSAAFAAEGDSPMVITTTDKTKINPGETLTITYTLDHDLEYMTRLDLVLRYDATLLKFVSTDVEGSVWFTKTGVDSVFTVDNENFVRVRQNRNANEDTISAGKICSITFMALDSINSAQKAVFYNSGKPNLYRSSIRVDEEFYYVEDTGFDHGADDPIAVDIIPSGSSITVPKVETGYTVSMGADQQAAAGQQVRIPVTVASGEKGITGFNAYDMAFTYDPAALTLNTKTGDATNLTVEDNNGTVRVRRYGATVPLGEALALDFTAKKAGTSTVTLTAAKFDLDANSINFDAPPATITDPDTNVKGLWKVTLPDGFVSAATDKSTLVEDGANFTFKPVDTNYEYTLAITTNGKTEEVTVKGSSYTIANITDNVQVTEKSRVGKTYTVKIEGSGADLVTGAAATAQFPNDYTFTVKAPGTGYRTTVDISNRGTYLTKNKFTTERLVNGDDVYTILGDSLAGDENNVITITVEKVENTIIKNIIVEGNGSEAFSPDNDMTFHYDENYTFRLNLDTAHYTYVIRAKYYRDNAPVMMNVIDNGDGTYTVLSPLAFDLHIVIEKFAKALDPNAVDVSKYLELDNKTIFIVSVYGTLQNKNADGTYSYIAYTYDGHLMYNTSYYVDPANDSKGASSWLVMVDRGETFTKEDALAKLAFQDSDKEQYDSISMTYWGKILENVNGSPSSNWDVNDSQFVYDLYNGVYDSFEKVSIKQFLLADQSQDRLLNSADAVTMTKRYYW